jgi:hypothetical protein
VRTARHRRAAIRVGSKGLQIVEAPTADAVGVLA